MQLGRHHSWTSDLQFDVALISSAKAFHLDPFSRARQGCLAGSP